MSLIKQSTWTVKGTTLQVRTDGDDVTVHYKGSPLFTMNYKQAEDLAEALNAAHDEVQLEKDTWEDREY